MKYTNETLKPQPSEDFTNINESEPYAYPTNLSSQYEKFEQENSARNREETKDENYNLQSENSASTKIVKISWLSLLKPTTTSRPSIKYSSGSISPGAKFQQRSIAKINSNHVEEFLKEKTRSANSWDKVERNATRNLFKGRGNSIPKFQW